MSRSLGDKLRSQGFDKTYYLRSERSWKVKCSCCEALVVNGVACHERGCRNQRRKQ